MADGADPPTVRNITINITLIVNSTCFDIILIRKCTYAVHMHGMFKGYRQHIIQTVVDIHMVDLKCS
jgi:hypothetical protein